MSLIPVSSTDIAKLMIATTGHMIASLVFLDDDPAFSAFTIMQILLHEGQLEFVALTPMLNHEAVAADLGLTTVADHHSLFSSLSPDDSLTVL